MNERLASQLHDTLACVKAASRRTAVVLLPGYRVLKYSFYDLRGSMRHLYMFFLCLSLGVGVMTCIASLAAGMRAGIAHDAMSLLGGDIEIEQDNHELPFPAVDYMLFHSTDISRILDIQATAATYDQIEERFKINNKKTGEKKPEALLLPHPKVDIIQMPVQLKGVDKRYPLYGALKLHDIQPGPVFFNHPGNDVYGAAVEQNLLNTLHLKPGQRFMIGDAQFEIRAILGSEPDRSLSGISHGPHVIASKVALRATGLLDKAHALHYRYRVKLPDGTNLSNIASWERGLNALYPLATWHIRDWTTNSPALASVIDRLALFFSLAALSMLAVAGTGIGNAARVYIWSHHETIAVMKCLGANKRYIVRMYLLQLLFVSLLAIACGSVAGTLSEMLLLHLMEHVLPVAGEGGIYTMPLLASAGLGLLTMLCFSVPPILRAATVRPLALFRNEEQVSALTWRQRPLLAIYATLVCGMLLLAMLFAGSVTLPFYFATGIIAAAILFHTCADAIRRLCLQRRDTQRLSVTLRMALGNLIRPDAVTRHMITGLGIGMMLLITLVQVGGNMLHQLDQDIAHYPPTLFLSNIAPDQHDAVFSRLHSEALVKDMDMQPILSGHIIALNGTPLDRHSVGAISRWALQGERAISSAAQMPPGTRLIAGQWWPADYKGAPLVSMDAQFARDMGLTTGDDITLAVSERSITATIASLRDTSWGTLEMDVPMILSPGALDGLPLSYAATVTPESFSGRTLGTLISNAFPDVIVTGSHPMHQKLNFIVRDLSYALPITLYIVILCGVMIMASTLNADMQKRLHTTVILKVLGVTRWRLLRIYMTEFAVILVVAAVGAIALGTLAAFALTQFLLTSPFTVMPGIILATLATCLFLALLFGLDATRTALIARPLAVLRDE